MRVVCPLGVLVLLVAAAMAGAACSPGAGSSPAAAPPAPAWAWDAVDPDPGSGSGPVTVVEWNGGFAGVGAGRAWTSSDGRTWSSTPLPDADEWPVGDLVATPTRLVASGRSGGVADTWASTDGASWTRSGDADLGPGDGYSGASVDRMAAGPAGIVAVGTEFGGQGQHPMAWWSEDGLDWTRTGEDLVGGGARDVAAGPSGYVIVGADTVPANDLTKAAFWFSPDGRTWEAISDDGTRARAEPQAVAATDDGFVAVGYRGEIGGMGAALSPVAWTSGDGTSWTLLEPTDDMAAWPFPGPTPVTGEGAIQGGVMWDVAAVQASLVAAGSYWGLDPDVKTSEGSHGMAQLGVAWQSADPASWAMLDEPRVRVSPGDDTTAPRYGFQRVAIVAGLPVILGAARDGGSMLWIGRTDGS